jgi:Na+/melibiose symporter-like transporter
LCVLVLTHEGSIAALYGVAFVLGLAETVYESSARALLPAVVDRSALDGANSLLTVEETLGQTFIGAPAGSALFTLAVVAPFALNAGGFLLAAALIMTLRGDFRPRRVGHTSVRRDMKDGLAWLRAHALLRGLTLISAATAFTQALATGVLVLYCLEVLHVPTSGYGLVLLAAGVGAVIGGLATPPLTRRFGRPVVLTAGALVCAVATVAMAFADNGVVGGTFFAVASAGVMTWNVITMSLRQALIPAELFGRVQGAYRTLVFGAVPLGSLIGGALAGPLGLRGVFVVSGAGMLICAGSLGRLVRRHKDELADGAAEPEPVSLGSAAG